MRRAPMTLLAAVAAAGISGCGGGGERDEDPASLRLPPAGRWFGFSSNTFQHTGRNALDQGVGAGRTVADAVGAGANSVRIQVAWWDLERRRGSIDRAYVGALRRFARAFEREGGRLVIVLGVPPPWAAAKPGDPRSAPRPDAVAAYARYAARVARLFPSALAIETWNEPNATFFWLPGRPDPRLYARMHAEAAVAIRRADGDVKVLLGGVIAVPRGSGEIVAPSEYLRAVRAAGVGPRGHDGVAVHVYPGERGGRMIPFEEGLEPALDDLREGAGPGARLWVTETGASTSGRDGLPAAEQSRALTATLARLFAYDDVEGVWVHTLYDEPSLPREDRERGFGVLRARGGRAAAPRAAYCALVARAGKSDARCR